MSLSSSAAWRIEAEPPAQGVSFQAYREGLIHETTKISDFLDEPSGEQFIIAAPKGFGKSLLLFAKRKQLEEKGGYRFSPGGELVERPDGSFPGLRKEESIHYENDYATWMTTWRVCFLIAAIKLEARFRQNHPEQRFEVALKNYTKRLDDWTKDIIDDLYTRMSPTDIFTSFFREPFRVRMAILKSETHLDGLCDLISSQIAYFVDNVDEYFQLNQEQGRIEDVEDDDTRKRRNDIWTLAQLGLIGAAYKLHKTNSHIKVFCTIRQEAFVRRKLMGSLHAQVGGCCLEVAYESRDLREIFQKNVRLMKPRRLFDLGNSDPMVQFFGQYANNVEHRFVANTEPAFDYLLRHTFYRPRDLMTIGKELASIDPMFRDELKFKKVVDEISDHIVDDLMTAMAPFFPLPNLDKLLPLIRRNVMTLEELKDVQDEYSRDLEVAKFAGEKHPFCVLARIGVLGIIRSEIERGSRKSRQGFELPNAVSFENDLHMPRTDRYYLIHPALDKRISIKAGEEYGQQFHTANIIGHEKSWREPPSSFFVIKGDIGGFSRIMENELYKAVVENLYAWVAETCGDLEFCEVSGGDSVLLIDRSAERIVTAALDLKEKAANHQELPLAFRFGGSAGRIEFQTFSRRMKGQWQQLSFPLGIALRTSARLEPHCPKGEILVDDEFIHLNKSARVTFVEMVSDELPSAHYDGNSHRFVIQKHTDDPPHITKLHRVGLRPRAEML